MRKQLFKLGIIALSSVIMLSSCAKDYDGDINDLRKQTEQNASDINALKASMNAGKLIKTVTPTETGFLVTFSDDSKITLTNGAVGATGATGSNGTNGTNGADGADGATGFVPVMGIDAEGYWTVKTSAAGTATRIKDALGNELKVTGAPGTNGTDGTDGTNGVDGNSPYIDGITGTWFEWDSDQNLYVDTEVKAEGQLTVATEIIDGILYVNGVNTGIQSIGIVYNETLRSYTFSIPKVGGGTDTFEIMQMSEALVMLTSISSPITSSIITAHYGISGFAGTFWDAQTYTVGQLLRLETGIKVPVMVNPSNANLDLYDLTLVYAKGTTLVTLPIDATRVSIAAGYDAGEDGAFTRAISSTGVWTVSLEPNEAEFTDLALLSGKKIAIQATLKDSPTQRILTSKYEYSFNFTQEVAVPTLDPSYNKISDIGSTFDVLSILSPSVPFYKSEITIDPAASAAIKAAITTTDSSITSASDDPAITALNGVTVNFTVKTIDFTGVEVSTTQLAVTFQMLYVASSPITLAEVTHVINVDNAATLTVDETQTAVLVADIKTKMGSAKFTEWIKNTTGLTASVVKKSDHSTALAGTTVALLKADAITATASPLDLKSVVITVDPTIATPTTDYQIEIVYTDANPAKSFEVYIPINLKNPEFDFATLFVQNSVFFLNNAVSTYGTDFEAATTNADLSAVLADSYSTHPSDPTQYGFVFDGSKNIDPMTLLPRVSPLTTDKDVTVGMSTMGITYTIDLYYYPFGNIANKQLVQTIKVTPMSSVENGAVIITAVPSTMNNTGGVKNLSTYFDVEDVNQNALEAFKALRSVRITSITVESSDPGMILITPSANDFTMTPNPNNTVMVTDAVVNLTFTVTDFYGKKLIKTVPMTVKK